MTKFNSRFALKLNAVLPLAALALPLAAQQDVSPEHFEPKPRVSRSHKAALPAHKTTAARGKENAGRRDSISAKAKSKAQVSSVLTADASRRSDSR